MVYGVVSDMIHTYIYRPPGLENESRLRMTDNQSMHNILFVKNTRLWRLWVQILQVIWGDYVF